MNHATDTSQRDLHSIYALLQKGLGHELVNDDNVFSLIALASRHGDTLVGEELREWQADCGYASRARAGGQ
jgi:hypothetical protein